MPVAFVIQLRRDSAANWTSVNPTLSSGECGIETDTGLLKTGDGVTAWTSLPYDASKLPTAFTAGSVLFVGATDVITQDNANFFWDDTNNRLGIGTATPTAYLHLKAGTATASTAPLKLTAGTLNTTPEAGAIEFDGDSYYCSLSGVRRSIVTGNDIRVASATVTNTTTETTIHTSSVAANSLKAGKLYRVTLLGKTTTSSAADFYTLRFKMGGVTLITVAMNAKNVSDEHFRSEYFITIRTIGAGGTYAAHVEGAIGDQVITATPVTGSVDTTIAEDLVTTLQWDAASAGNIFTIMQSVLEVIG